MTEVGAPSGLMFSMLLGTGIMIGTWVTILIVSIAWYRKEERER